MRLDPAHYEIPDRLRSRDYMRRHRRKKKDAVHIAILDLETDPFDNKTRGEVYPFLAVLYCPTLLEQPVTIWCEDWERLISQVHSEILSLPEPCIIYAHNGGRFDWLYFMRALRGQVLFKGRALMSAKVGPHEIRDSFHIIPEALKNANRKTEIDYNLFRRGTRNAHKREITEYCIDDCAALYEIVIPFKAEFGVPLTIGQAAMATLKKRYTFDCLSERTDDYFRQWFHGGRVDCIGQGVFDPTDLRLYDVNSMYPYVMARFNHPISNIFAIKRYITERTIFLTLACKNAGALVSRANDGSLTTRMGQGIFNTTIFEYQTALKHGLISDVEIIRTIEFDRVTNFADFVEPLYNGRQLSKELKDKAEREGDLVAARNYARDVLFRKLLMNNAYGKFAQNPRRFKIHCITDPMELPDDTGAWGDLPAIEHDNYWVWQRPNDDRLRFNNVATAASITGAARAVLLDALATSISPVYCDTDSIICHRLDASQQLDKYALGAWDIEANISAFIGNGKKLYAYRNADRDPPKNTVVKAKGANDVTWAEMLSIANGSVVTKTMRAPTIGKDGSQVYLTRELRRTLVS